MTRFRPPSISKGPKAWRSAPSPLASSTVNPATKL